MPDYAATLGVASGIGDRPRVIGVAGGNFLTVPGAAPGNGDLPILLEGDIAGFRFGTA